MKIMKNKRVIAGIAFIVFILIARFFGIGTYLNLATVKLYSEQLKMFVQNHYVPSIASYILLYITGTALSIPVALLLTVTGGFLFGAILGTLYANIGATIGASISFLIIRHSVGTHLQEKYSAQLAHLNAEMDRDGALYLLAVRLIAIFPFFLLNILIGLTKVPLSTFIWTTSLGIVPSSFVFAFAGQQIHSINSPRDIFSPRILLAFALLAALSLLPVAVRRIRGRSSR